MKRRCCWVWLLLLSVLVQGCDLSVFPADLLARPEKPDVGRITAEMLPSGARLMVPAQFEDAGAVNQVDMDGDGRDELVMVTGWKDDLGIRLLVQTRVGKEWKTAAEAEQPAHDLVDALAFRDVTGDGRPEIILGTGTEPVGEISGELPTPKTVSVYTYRSGRLDLLWSGEYNDRFAATDFGGDSRAEIVRFVREHSGDRFFLHAFLTVCGPNGCESRGTVTFSGLTCETMMLPVNRVKHLLVGRADPHGKGLYVDVSVGAGSFYTELLAYDGRQFQRVLTGADRKRGCRWTLFPSVELETRDTDGNGYPEIPSTVQNENVRVLSEAGPRLISYFERRGTTGWLRVRQEYEWRDGESGRLFMFRFPSSWLEGVTLEETEDRVRFDYVDASGNRSMLLLIHRGDREHGETPNGKTVWIRRSGTALKAVIPERDPDLPEGARKRYEKMRIGEEELLRLIRPGHGQEVGHGADQGVDT
ncbi:FG-GAP repeat domain-containing protein [Staphylospora marina]|uniref:FG-GAP repeat domain-containing protein n=1 Tax=Staphylospora marina TaxID=2490858 RepID=UPI000F5C16C8|nr:VCBS repeat-containing protein [Staphylospora marina]